MPQWRRTAWLMCGDCDRGNVLVQRVLAAYRRLVLAENLGRWSTHPPTYGTVSWLAGHSRRANDERLPNSIHDQL